MFMNVDTACPTNTLMISSIIPKNIGESQLAELQEPYHSTTNYRAPAYIAGAHVPGQTASGKKLTQRSLP